MTLLLALILAVQKNSCDPNCATAVVEINGKYTIAMYTLRKIAYGEELTQVSHIWSSCWYLLTADEYLDLRLLS